MSTNLTLVFGNRTYSSWSLRGWLVMAMSGLDFAEQVVWLDAPGYRKELLEATGGFGSVPTLRIDGSTGDASDRRFVGDSLAIAEYAAEWAPDAGVWPLAPLDRAEARSLAARMHSGFPALRKACPMNLSNKFPGFAPEADVIADLADLEALWTPRLERSGGPFLFGEFGAVDAMFAPVATRIETFCLPVTPPCSAYVSAILAHPLMRQWIAAAAKEPEIDRPRTDRLTEGWFTPGDWPVLTL